MERSIDRSPVMFLHPSVESIAGCGEVADIWGERRWSDPKMTASAERRRRDDVAQERLDWSRLEGEPKLALPQGRGQAFDGAEGSRLRCE
jgi:hypothetical protein